MLVLKHTVQHHGGSGAGAKGTAEVSMRTGIRSSGSNCHLAHAPRLPAAVFTCLAFNTSSYE